MRRQKKLPDLKVKSTLQNKKLKEYWDAWNNKYPEEGFSWWRLRWRQIYLKSIIKLKKK